jgi:hypothetical protein
MTRRWAVVAMVLLVGGCASKAPAPRGEAAAVAQDYFDALVRQDWPAAYAKLHPDAKSHWRAEAFAKAAEQFRRGLGIEPETATVGACEERGDEAIAHVQLTGHAADKRKLLKEAVALRRSDAGWGVVPPPQFGQLARVR